MLGTALDCMSQKYEVYFMSHVANYARSQNPSHIAIQSSEDIASMIALFLLLGVAAAARQCYFPDGSQAPKSTTPCIDSAETSHCCGETDICLSNGLCWDQDRTYYNRMVRAACTDKSWTSGECPQQCQDGESLSLSFMDHLLLLCDLR